VIEGKVRRPWRGVQVVVPFMILMWVNGIRRGFYDADIIERLRAIADQQAADTDGPPEAPS